MEQIIDENIVINYRKPDKDDLLHVLTFVDVKLQSQQVTDFISPTANRIITSNFNASFIAANYNIFNCHGFDLDKSFRTYVKGKTYVFTLLDSKYSVGSVAILVQGEFGNALYTGNFCYYPGFCKSPALIPLLQRKNPLTTLYLDATYYEQPSDFCGFEDNIIIIVQLLQKFYNRKVYIYAEKFSMDPIICDVANRLQEVMYVDTTRMENMKLLKQDEYFTTDITKSRILVAKGYTKKRGEQDDLVIILYRHPEYTNKFFQSGYNKTKNVYFFYFFCHSNNKECCKIISELRPEHLVPIQPPIIDPSKIMYAHVPLLNVQKKFSFLSNSLSEGKNFEEPQGPTKSMLKQRQNKTSQRKLQTCEKKEDSICIEEIDLTNIHSKEEPLALHEEHTSAPLVSSADIFEHTQLENLKLSFPFQEDGANKPTRPKDATINCTPGNTISSERPTPSRFSYQKKKKKNGMTKSIFKKIHALAKTIPGAYYSSLKKPAVSDQLGNHVPCTTQNSHKSNFNTEENLSSDSTDIHKNSVALDLPSTSKMFTVDDAKSESNDHLTFNKIKIRQPAEIDELFKSIPKKSSGGSFVAWVIDSDIDFHSGQSGNSDEIHSPDDVNSTCNVLSEPENVIIPDTEVISQVRKEDSLQGYKLIPSTIKAPIRKEQSVVERVSVPSYLFQKQKKTKCPLESVDSSNVVNELPKKTTVYPGIINEDGKNSEIVADSSLRDGLTNEKMMTISLKKPTIISANKKSGSIVVTKFDSQKANNLKRTEKKTLPELYPIKCLKSKINNKTNPLWTNRPVFDHEFSDKTSSTKSITDSLAVQFIPNVDKLNMNSNDNPAGKCYYVEPVVCLGNASIVNEDHNYTSNIPKTPVQASKNSLDLVIDKVISDALKVVNGQDKAPSKLLSIPEDNSGKFNKYLDELFCKEAVGITDVKNLMEEVHLIVAENPNLANDNKNSQFSCNSLVNPQTDKNTTSTKHNTYIETNENLNNIENKGMFAVNYEPSSSASISGSGCNSSNTSMNPTKELDERENVHLKSIEKNIDEELRSKFGLRNCFVKLNKKDIKKYFFSKHRNCFLVKYYGFSKKDLQSRPYQRMTQKYLKFCRKLKQESKKTG